MEVILEQNAENMDEVEIEIGYNQSTSLATNDVATDDIQQDISSAQRQGQQLVVENIYKWLVRKDAPFFDPIKRNKSKTFATLYDNPVSLKNEKK